MAEIDLGNVMGPQGEPGSQWYYGTAITGTNNTGTIFPNSGISKAVINDKYLNTSTSNVYTCTVGGAASAAKWAYIGNIKGEKGNTGATGPTGQVDENTPIEFTEASTEADINSGESLATMFGKIKKSIKTFRTSIGTLASLKTTVKDSLVSAINELKTGLGTVGELDTTAKDSVVNAINELNENKADSEEISSQIKSLTQNISTITSNLGQKLNVSDVANNLTTTASGKALDARQGKALNDKLTTHKSSGDHDGRYYTETEINSKLSQKLNLSGGTMTGTLKMNVNVPIQWTSDAKIYSPTSQNLYMAASNEGNYFVHIGVHDSRWALDPDVANTMALGTPNHRWTQGFFVTNPDVSSDRNKKNSISKISERYAKMFNSLVPVTFRYNDEDSGKLHIGFIAQDVKDAMVSAGISDSEFAGFCQNQKTIPVRKEKQVKVLDNETGQYHEETIAYTQDEPVDGEYEYSLRYGEFIALNTLMIQKLDERISALESLLGNQKKD